MSEEKKTNQKRTRNLVLSGIALAAVVALTLVYTIPRSFSKLLFPEANEVELESIFLRVTDPSKGMTEDSTKTLSVYEHDKLTELEAFIREAKVTYCGVFSEITLRDIAYDVDLSIVMPGFSTLCESCSFTVIKGGDVVYLWSRRNGVSVGRKYKMNAGDAERLVAILQTLAQEQQPCAGFGNPSGFHSISVFSQNRIK